MGNTYNLGNSSDMKRFSQVLEESIMDFAKEAAYDMDFDVECPHCNKISTMHPGLNVCPFCKNEVNLELDIDF